jgi:signal transduction histidine kinase
LASVAVAILALAFALRFVTERATRSAEAELGRGLDEASGLVARRYASRLDALATTARLVADLPLLKAAVTTSDPLTVEPVALDYASLVKVPLLALAGREGSPLAVVGPHAEAGVDAGDLREALSGHEVRGFRSGPRGVLHAITVPMAFRTRSPEVVGALTLALALDDALAEDLRGVTESQVALVSDGRVLASSLPGVDFPTLRPVLSSMPRATDVTLAGDDYVALARPLAGARDPHVVVLRSRTERLRFLEPLRTALLAAAGAAVLGAVLLSFMVSRTVTRPLASITKAMRDIARTGDFTRKVPEGRSFYDEDARVLTAAFNSLLDSVLRFQREAAEKERLSALGRLSTVIAHEVRNPLMIIKAALSGLRREAPSRAEVDEAVADIDHEVERLDHIVGDVLDFARPPRLLVQATDLNEVCKEAAARLPAEDREKLSLGLDFGGPGLLTDGERLKTALVNVLGNARESGGPGDPPPRIELRTANHGEGGALILVRDDGIGIADRDLPHVFEPYFTTKRSGTGLGLAIARNLVEALGGSICAERAPGRGTEIRIELPKAAPRAAESEGT